MKKYFVITFLLVLVVPIASFQYAKAAEIYFGVNNKTVAKGAKFEVGVFVDSQGQSINALEGEIRFPVNTLSFEGFYTGNSSVTFWVKQPTLVSDGVVSFAGIVPGGFNGKRGYLFSLLLVAKAQGAATITTSQENILLNDGQGSAAMVTRAPFAVTISNTASEEPFTPMYDADPPEPFTIEIASNVDAFDGKWFLSYLAQDKGSGINHYEVLEKKHLGSIRLLFLKSSWVRADSPYVLQDQSLTSNIWVKAVDRAGNQRVSELKHRRSVPLYENYFFYIIIILIAIIFIKLRAWKYFTKKP